MVKRIFTWLLLTTISATLTWSCKDDDDANAIPNLDFRAEMRLFVEEISQYAKSTKSGFFIVPQNGQELLTANSEPDGPPAEDYINAIDAVGREDLFYGYEADDQATPVEDRDYMISFCNVAKSYGKRVLTIDYCSTPSKMDDAFAQNQINQFASFQADHRELDNIPDYPSVIRNMNADDITNLSQARNFIFLINPSAFASKAAFINALKATDYDVLIIDLFFSDGEQLTASDVESLKVKHNGGSRLVIAYMSIGEAEDYRYYWSDLDKSLIYKSNPDWPGNYAVKYWENSWKKIIYGNDTSYTKKLIDAGFDGAYLDIIEAYEYFE